MGRKRERKRGSDEEGKGKVMLTTSTVGYPSDKWDSCWYRPIC